MKLASRSDRPVVTIGGVAYTFRTPTAYDLPRMSWRLTRARVRRPAIGEYRAAALAGVTAIAMLADAVEEGNRQCDLVERWYDELLPEPVEDDIDEPDFERRAVILAERKATRQAGIAEVLPSILAIEANLDRHWQDWAELRADAKLWDQVSAIDAARLLLDAIDSVAVSRVAEGDEQGLMDEAAWLAIPAAHRARIGTAALGLLAPSEAERKN